MRLFWALPLPDPVKQAIRDLQRGLRSVHKDGRWTDPENLHLTLVFLGEVEAERLPQLQEAGRIGCRGTAPLELRTAGIGAFPRLSAARILWLGLEENPELQRLVQRLREAMRPIANLEDRPFQPHLTLARFRTTVPLGDLDAPPSLSWIAGGMTLFQSHLGRSLRHEPMATVPFRA